MRFQVGDIVRISSKHALYNRIGKELGEIIGIDDERMCSIEVKWVDSGIGCMYFEKSLKLYKRNPCRDIAEEYIEAMRTRGLI